MRGRAVVLILLLSSTLAAQKVHVPFVGCAQDGQAGPVDAPKGSDVAVRMDAGPAQRLAFYTIGKSFGAIAPRDWFCFGTYGSSGADLLITPERLKREDLSSKDWSGLTGPVVEVQGVQGGGPGTYEWSRVVARVFPSLWPIVQGLVNTGDLPVGEFIFGPYPNDKLIVQTKHAVECETPARSEGLGTTQWLKPNADPINTAAILVGHSLDLLMLRIRLPHELSDLTPAIVREFEREHK